MQGQWIKYNHEDTLINDQVAIGGSAAKNLPAKAGDTSSIPGLGGFPGEGNGNPLQYSCLGNPMGRRVWWTVVHGAAKAVNTT